MSNVNKLSSAALIQSRVDQFAYYQRELKVLRAHRRQLTITAKFVNAISPRFGECQITSWTDTAAWMNTVELHVSIRQSTRSMKEGPICFTISALMEAGFEPGATTDYTTYGSGTREFKFTRAADPERDMLKITVTLDAILIDAPDATCRKVQVGTQIKEEPVYKLVCEE